MAGCIDYRARLSNAARGRNRLWPRGALRSMRLPGSDRLPGRTSTAENCLFCPHRAPSRLTLPLACPRVAFCDHSNPCCSRCVSLNCHQTESQLYDFDRSWRTSFRARSCAFNGAREFVRLEWLHHRIASIVPIKLPDPCATPRKTIDIPCNNSVGSVSGTVACGGDRMNARRRLVLALTAGALAAPLASFAQQPAKIARIGFLSPASPAGDWDTRLQALRDGLRELGYVEGKNLELKVLWGEGRLDRLPALATELVQAKVDVIVAATSPAVLAANRATRTIPIVMPLSSDPVGIGLVASLARPGGNITGLSQMARELGEKRIQLLKDMFPKVSHAMDVLWNPDYVGMRARFEQARVAAPAVGLTARSVEVRDSRELD